MKPRLPKNKQHMKKHSRLAALVGLVPLALAVGCSDNQPAAEPTRATTATQTLRPTVRDAVLLHGTTGGRLLLHGLVTRRLLPETTMQPRYRLRVADQRGQLRAALPGDPEALGGALSPEGRRAAAVLPNGRLLLTGAALAADVPPARPGLAFSPKGDRLAFVCGDAPETDVCLLDVCTGRWRRIAGGEGPQDRPAFSADGREVLFVSASDGVAAIWRVGLTPGARPAQLTNVGLGQAGVSGPRFVPPPVGPHPMVAVGSALVLDTGEAVVLLGGDGSVRSMAPTGTLVLRGHGGRVVLIRRVARGLRIDEVAP